MYRCLMPILCSRKENHGHNLSAQSVIGIHSVSVAGAPRVNVTFSNHKKLGLGLKMSHYHVDARERERGKKKLELSLLTYRQMLRNQKIFPHTKNDIHRYSFKRKYSMVKLVEIDHMFWGNLPSYTDNHITHSRQTEKTKCLSSNNSYMF